MLNDINLITGRLEGILPVQNLEVIVKFNGVLDELAEQLEVEAEDLGKGYAIINAPASRIVALYADPRIEYIEFPKIITHNLRQSLARSCITTVHSPDGYNLTGEGVLVAIIDSGVDYTHPDFRNENGTSRILFFWDQTGDGPFPNGFNEGTEYTNDQLNEALQSVDPFSVIPDLDTVGHGTAVAGVAAGNGRASSGQNVGVAPDSTLLVVRLGQNGSDSSARTSEIMRAIKYIYDKAVLLSMPVSINLSFGSNNGAHNGNSLFEEYVNAMADTWKSVFVVSSGNEGSAGHHFSARIAQGETVYVDFIVSGGYPNVYVTMWKNFVDDLSVELITPSGLSSGIIRSGDPITYFSSQNANMSIFYGQPTRYSVAQEIFFFIETRQEVLPSGLFRLIVRGDHVVVGDFDLWLPTVEEVTTSTAFLQPSTATTLTLPSTALNVIAVGGYNSATNSAASFSGRGYTREEVYVKPDLVAPAVAIVTARAGGGYDAFSGTSIAAPFVTGSAALMMQWGIVQGHDPFLYGAKVKAYLRKGASRSPDLDYPNPIWGYGQLCLQDTMDELFLQTI